jgi:hypothetical protein
MVSDRAIEVVSLVTAEDLFMRLLTFREAELESAAADAAVTSAVAAATLSGGSVSSVGHSASSAISNTTLSSASMTSMESFSRDGIAPHSAFTPRIACVLLPAALLTRVKDLVKQEHNALCLSDRKLYVLADLQLARSVHVKETAFVTGILLLPIRKADLLLACRCVDLWVYPCCVGGYAVG